MLNCYLEFIPTPDNNILFIKARILVILSYINYTLRDVIDSNWILFISVKYMYTHSTLVV